jgi:predicted GIY-YIG superfamily endonuclease
MMAFFACLLRCTDASYYAGQPDNRDLHMAQHAGGECGGYTTMRLPAMLLWSQEFATREEALAKNNFGNRARTQT